MFIAEGSEEVTNYTAINISIKVRSTVKMRVDVIFATISNDLRTVESCPVYYI